MFKFLNLKPEIFGIDINDLSLRIIKLKKKGRGFGLVSFNDVDIPPGIVTEGVIRDEVALANIIDRACKTVKGKKIDTKYVVVALPEEKSFAQVIQMPKMTEEELRLAVPFEAENYIPLPIEKGYLDFQVINYHKVNANHLDLLINVMPKTVIDSYVSCFKKTGLIPCILEVESQSVVRAFMRNTEKNPPAIFIDFGETKTGLIIYAENSIRFTVTVPISSSHLTKAIAQHSGIDFNSAEKLKIERGLDPTIKEYGVMTSVVDQLVEHVKKYIDFYRNHSSHEYFPSDGSVNKIIVCGGGAHLKGLPAFLSKKLDIVVELGNPLVAITDTTKRFPKNRVLLFGTAIGSALRGANDTYLNSYSDTI